MTDASSETPVLDTLAAMTAESIARCRLDANVGPAMDAGVTIEQVQNILVSRRRAGATITPRSGQCRCFDRG